MILKLVIFLLLYVCFGYGYDEIQTQLHRVWRNTRTNTDSNPCLKKSLAFKHEKLEDAFLEKFVLNVMGTSPGYHTMVSNPRLKATLILVKAALVLPAMGDIVETGVNAGGSACVIMRFLMEYDACHRKFWGFDSFSGFPTTAKEDGVWGVGGKKGDMAVSQETFEGNLMKWNAWDNSTIVVTKGYFSETLPRSNVSSISLLRLDGDIFISTWDALVHLYPKVVPGGYVYVDDYGSFQGCREAVDRYRSRHHIWAPLHFIREENIVGSIRFEAVWWRVPHQHEHHNITDV